MDRIQRRRYPDIFTPKASLRNIVGPMGLGRVRASSGARLQDLKEVGRLLQVWGVEPLREPVECLAEERKGFGASALGVEEAGDADGGAQLEEPGLLGPGNIAGPPEGSLGALFVRSAGTG